MKPPFNFEEIWKEIIDTCVKNKDPKYSFELFKGSIEKNFISKEQAKKELKKKFSREYTKYDKFEIAKIIDEVLK